MKSKRSAIKPILINSSRWVIHQIGQVLTKNQAKAIGTLHRFLLRFFGRFQVPASRSRRLAACFALRLGGKSRTCSRWSLRVFGGFFFHSKRAWR